MAEKGAKVTPSLGQRIRARRHELGRTLSNVAQDTDLSIQYLSNLERGRGNPTMQAIERIAAALDVPITDLLGETNLQSDPTEAFDILLAGLPRSLLDFSRTERFRRTVADLSHQLGEPVEEVRKRLLVSMNSAPRRSSGPVTAADWHRLLMAYELHARK